jgi:hypothetical protein
LDLANGRAISTYFPGRSIKTIQNVFSKRKQFVRETFTKEKVTTVLSDLTIGLRIEKGDAEL